jgi:4,5-DOPA dioxygenase extradiol
LFFDYYGFPPETYKFNYNASSTKELRKRVIDVVASQGFNLKTKGKRGYDHGVFIPLMIMYPKADIPVIQISLE